MMSARPDTLEGGFRPLQIYEQVAEKIRDEIRAGRYAAESRLPSERELAVLFQVGRPAVRDRRFRQQDASQPEQDARHGRAVASPRFRCPSYQRRTRCCTSRWCSAPWNQCGSPG